MALRRCLLVFFLVWSGAVQAVEACALANRILALKPSARRSALMDIFQRRHGLSLESYLAAHGNKGPGKKGSPLDVAEFAFLEERGRLLDQMDRIEGELYRTADELKKEKARPTPDARKVAYLEGKLGNLQAAWKKEGPALRKRLAEEYAKLGNTSELLSQIGVLEAMSSDLRTVEEALNRQIQELQLKMAGFGSVHATFGTPVDPGRAMQMKELARLTDERDAATLSLWMNQERLGTLRAARMYALHEGLTKKFVTWTDYRGKKQTTPLVDIPDVMSPKELAEHFTARGMAPMYGPKDMAWLIEMRVPDQVLVELLEAGKITSEEYSSLKITRKYGGPQAGGAGEFYGVDRNYRRRSINGQVDATPDLPGVWVNQEDAWAHVDPLVQWDPAEGKIRGQRFLAGSIGAMGSPTGDAEVLRQFRAGNWGMGGHGGAFQFSIGEFDKGRRSNGLAYRDPATGTFGVRWDATAGKWVSDTTHLYWQPKPDPPPAPPFYPVLRNVPSLNYSDHSRMDPEYGVHHILNLGENIRDLRTVLRASYKVQRGVWDFGKQAFVMDPTFDPAKARREAPSIELTADEARAKALRLGVYKGNIAGARQALDRLRLGLNPDSGKPLLDFDPTMKIIRDDLDNLDRQIRELEDLVKAG